MVRADLIVGIIANVLSILTFIAPLKTFRKIVKDKSAANFDGLPYITTLLCASLWTFYGLLDLKDGLLIVTVNSVGIVLQTVYNILFVIYAPKQKRIKSLVLLGVLNIVVLGAVVVVTLFALHGSARRMFIGVLCATVTTGMYAAPLKVMGTVIRTKSVKYMPFFLSLSLFLTAGAWLSYAILLKDYYILVPNVAGIVLGVTQLTIYAIYKSKPSPVDSTSDIDVKRPTDKNENGIKMQVIDLEDGNVNQHTSFEK